MRHDVDWVQRTHDALEHLHENIAQPIIFRGYDTKDKIWREFVLSPKQTVNDVAVMHVYLQRDEEFDAHQAGFKLLLEYFMMAPEEQVKRHSDYAQLIASLISGHMK